MAMSPEERKRRDRERKRKRYREDAEHRAQKLAASVARASANPQGTAEAAADYHRRRYETDAAYRTRRRAATRAWKQAHVQRVSAIITQAKDRPCVDCGKQYHPCCMEFDHVRGVKSFGLAKAARTNRSMQEVLDEIAKCEIRCVICHRMRHLVGS